LERCGVAVESKLWFLCGFLEEPTSHLFCGCRVSCLVWNLCYAWLGVSSVDPLIYVSHFMQFICLDAPMSVNLIIGNIWIAVVSKIWRHRNNLLFKARVIDYSEFFSLTQLKVWSWISLKLPLVGFSFLNWCLEPRVCMLSIKKGS